MSSIPYETLAAWCGEVAAGFRGHEHRLQEDLRRDRDACLVEFTIRYLAIGDDDTTTQLVERIDRIRAGMETAD